MCVKASIGEFIREEIQPGVAFSVHCSERTNERWFILTTLHKACRALGPLLRNVSTVNNQPHRNESWSRTYHFIYEWLSLIKKKIIVRRSYPQHCGVGFHFLMLRSSTLNVDRGVWAIEMQHRERMDLWQWTWIMVKVSCRRDTSLSTSDINSLIYK